VLVALSLHVRDNLGGHVALFGANDRCRDQLHTLGVDHLFDIEPDGLKPEGAQTNENMEALPWPYRSREAWAGTILEAHETLAKVDPANANRLQDVIDYMQQHKKTQFQ
jgi:hypothetical protein